MHFHTASLAISIIIIVFELILLAVRSQLARALPDAPNLGMTNEEQMIATKRSSFCCVIHSSSFFYTFILTQQSYTYQVAAFLMSTVRSTSGKLGSARPTWSVTVLMARTNDVYIGKPVPY